MRTPSIQSLPRLLIALVALPCAAPVGCGRDAPRADPADPARFVERMRELHQARRYRELEYLVDPSRSAPVINTLMAVDRLLEAGADLQATAEHRLGPRAAVLADLGGLADQLGPFSRRVEVVAVRMEGPQAVVSYQVAQRVPIERLRLGRIDGRWRYQPDDPDPALPRILVEITENLGTLRAAVEQGRFDEPGFLREYRQRIILPLQTHLRQVAAARRAPATSQQ